MNIASVRAPLSCLLLLALSHGARGDEGQEVPFTTIGEGANGPEVEARELVITSARALRKAGLEPWLDASVGPVDWKREMVVAVLMGGQPSGGYSVRVESIVESIVLRPGHGYGDEEPLPIPALEVRYRTEAPDGAATQAFTWPYHIVKLERRKEPVRFVVATDPPAPAAVFTAAALEYDTGPIGATGDTLGVEVAAEGAVIVSRSTPDGALEPVHGRANEAELSGLREAIAAARLSSVPFRISPGLLHIAAGRGFQLGVTSDQAALAGQTLGELGRYGPYADRLRPLVSALTAIAERVLHDAAGPFVKASLRYETGPGDAFRIEVAADGSAVVTQVVAGAAPPAPVRLSATEVELARLRKAIEEAKVASLPDPFPPSVLPFGFEVAVESDRPELGGDTRGTIGTWGAHETRILPLIEALQAIADRAIQQPAAGGSLVDALSQD